MAVSFRDFRECSQNSREPPCYTDFYEVCYPFYLPLWGTTWESVAVLANFANLLKTRTVFRHAHAGFSLNANYYNILLLVLGMGGTLAKAKGGAKRKV